MRSEYEKMDFHNMAKMMQGVPNFEPRRQGLFVFKEEKAEVIPDTYIELIRETMKFISCESFHLRLEQYLKQGEECFMDYRNEEHQKMFKRAVEKLNRKSYSLMSAVYLLTAEVDLWNKTKSYVIPNNIKFDEIRLQYCSGQGYTLFYAAKDLYLGTDYLKISELADTKVIPTGIFGVICNAMAIRRFGLGAIHFRE